MGSFFSNDATENEKTHNVLLELDAWEKEGRKEEKGSVQEERFINTKLQSHFNKVKEVLVLLNQPYEFAIEKQTLRVDLERHTRNLVVGLTRELNALYEQIDIQTNRIEMLEEKLGEIQIVI